MKKMLFMLLSVCFMPCANGQLLSSAKAAEVTNYKEVLSQIDYPQACVQEGIEGRVIVSLKVDAKGNLVSHEFISYPCPNLKRAVTKALPKLKFNTAINRHGDAVAGRVTIPIIFKLAI
ncbi:MAG: TonB family protein [Ekhidna sp.]|nr:TonB family protein [Ekhidna sp.]MBC6410540.1 TonB family protein [Ekhidna sp.]